MTVRQKSLLTAVVLISLGAVLAPLKVSAGESASLNLVLIGEKAHIDPSTKALARGHYKSAKRHAERALRQGPDEMGALLAQHNLCVAFTMMGQSTQARPHCMQAASSDLDAGLKPRGKNFLSVSTLPSDQQASGLREALQANLQRIGYSPDGSSIAQQNGADEDQSSAL